MTHLKKTLGCVGLVMFGALAVTRAGTLKIELPTETATLKKSAGIEVATAQCVTCHSADYIAIQPPLPRAGWQAVVVKMQQKYAAPLPPEQVEAIVNYLTANYGSEPAAK